VHYLLYPEILPHPDFIVPISSGFIRMTFQARLFLGEKGEVVIIEAPKKIWYNLSPIICGEEEND